MDIAGLGVVAGVIQAIVFFAFLDSHHRLAAVFQIAGPRQAA